MCLLQKAPAQQDQAQLIPVLRKDLGSHSMTSAAFDSIWKLKLSALCLQSLKVRLLLSNAVTT